MTSLRELATQILAALAVHEKVTIKHPQPKRLWRLLKAELRMCDVTFDDQAVHVTWKAIESKSGSTTVVSAKGFV